MKFSVWPNMNRPPAEVLDLARLADREGWHGIWYADHYMPNTDSEAFAPGDVFECWAMVPAIAAVTERVRIGTLVSPTSVHHPAVLANRAATIDHLSNGRLILGIGAGWQINEHRAYGIELEPPATRVDRFEEAIQIVKSLLTEDGTTFEGTHYSILDAPCDPKPLQSPLPILVGTSSPRMLRITATHADEWNTWGAPALAGAGVAKLLQACERVGRDPETLRKSTQALVIVTADSKTADKVRAGQWGPRSLAGTIDQIVEQVAEYVALGLDEFIIPDFTFGGDQAEREGNLTEVVRALTAAHG
jgi:probable F420-dependent oxidoreductase